VIKLPCIILDHDLVAVLASEIALHWVAGITVVAFTEMKHAFGVVAENVVGEMGYSCIFFAIPVLAIRFASAACFALQSFGVNSGVCVQSINIRK
jgi:hypothetical protein